MLTEPGLSGFCFFNNLRFGLFKNSNIRISSMFHSVPGVPRAKMERFEGLDPDECP
jgi:hypothetical protein